MEATYVSEGTNITFKFWKGLYRVTELTKQFLYRFSERKWTNQTYVT